MKKSTVVISVKAIPNDELSVRERYENFVKSMNCIEGPFGFKGVDTSKIPEFGVNPLAGMRIKYPVKSIKFVGGYSTRKGSDSYLARSMSDDYVWIGFKLPNKEISYENLINFDFPKIIESFHGYRAWVDLNEYYISYCGGYDYTDEGENAFDVQGNAVRNNESYNALARDGTIDIDGRNNIFGLRPVQYWSQELCQLALCFSPEEVKRRLDGKVKKVELINGGVYVVLNDDPYLTYGEFLEINMKYKKILGLL